MSIVRLLVILLVALVVAGWALVVLVDPMARYVVVFVAFTTVAICARPIRLVVIGRVVGGALRDGRRDRW